MENKDLHLQVICEMFAAIVQLLLGTMICLASSTIIHDRAAFSSSLRIPLNIDGEM